MSNSVLPRNCIVLLRGCSLTSNDGNSDSDPLTLQFDTNVWGCVPEDTAEYKIYNTQLYEISMQKNDRMLFTQNLYLNVYHPK